MREKQFKWGILAISGVGLACFLVTFFMGSPEQGLLARMVFNLSLFITLSGIIFFIAEFIYWLVDRIFKKYVNSDIWHSFYRSIFLSGSVVLFFYLQRTGLFYWPELIFWVLLWAIWEYVHQRSLNQLGD